MMLYTYSAIELSVCPSVCHTCEIRQNNWMDWAAIPK